MTQNKLGEYLRYHRQRAQLSVRQLAGLVGVDHAYLVRLEAGQQSNPSTDLAARLAEVLELDASELLTLFGATSARTLPAPRVYFRHKYGVSETEANDLARLIEDYTSRLKEDDTTH